jgi:nitrite reductase (NADH) small subunit
MTEVMIGRVDDVPVGEGRTFAVDGAQIAVFRLRDGSLRAIDAVCPHKGGPLADGLADDRVCTGAEAGGSVSVRSYPVSIADGTIRITRPV